MMSNLAFSYMSLTAGGSLELSVSDVASSGDGADRFSRKPCARDAVVTLLTLMDCHPLPVLPGVLLSRPMRLWPGQPR